MKHLRKYNESRMGSGETRISEEVLNVLEILSNYETFDLAVFDCIRKINEMSDEELEEFYESVSSNRRENNSDEENFMIDIIDIFR